MTLREKMAQRAEPLLEPGEEIQEIFPTRTRQPGWGGYFNELLRTIWIVAATDRNIVVFTTRFWTQTTPRSVACRLPRDTQLGHPTGSLFAELNLSMDGRTMLVQRRFFDDVDRANARMAGS